MCRKVNKVNKTRLESLSPPVTGLGSRGSDIKRRDSQFHRREHTG